MDIATAERIGPGKFVAFAYTIHDEGGELLECIDLPVGYVHGVQGGLIPLVERALAGHAVGDTVEVSVPPEEGFGAHDPNLTFTDDIDNVPPEFHRIGAEVEFQNDVGDVKTFVVSSIEDGRLTVDGNHPLAGKTLRYTVTVHEIRDATAADYARGPVGPSHIPTLQ